MATYVNDLRLKEIATGDEAGTWGTSTNTNLELIGEALGYGTQDCFASDADATTTVADGASDPARAMYFKVTSSATLTATRTLTIAPNTISRVMLIENATTGSQSITISQGSGSTVTIASGAVKMVYLDGAGAGGAVVEALADLELPTVTVADLTATTADINAGTIDGTVIGGTTAAAITGTTITGTSFVSSGDMTFGDSDKAIFGAGSDLQIYHDGSDSYITHTTGGNFFINDDGAGYLMMKGSDLYFRNPSNVDMIHAQSGGFVKLYHNGVAKLATTATGIDVTGTVTADGLTVDGTAIVSDSTASVLRLLNTGTTGDGLIHFGDSASNFSGVIQYNHDADYMALFTDTQERMRIDSSGNVGIGVVPSSWASNTFDALQLGVGIGVGNLTARVDGINAVGLGLNWYYGGGATNTYVASSFATNYVQEAGTHKWLHAASGTAGAALTFTESMRIDSSGNVGIGTTTPQEKTHSVGRILSTTQYGASTQRIGTSIGENGNTRADIDFRRWTGAAANHGVGMIEVADTGVMAFYTDTKTSNTPATTERMRIDASGNVGIGETSPSTFGKLVVTGSTPFAVLRSSDVTTAGFSMLVNGGSNGVGSIATDDGGHLTFDTGSTGAGQAERMRIDSSGNLGLGVTPSAWNSGYKAMQLLTGALYGTSSRDTNLGANVFVNAGGGYAYIQSSFATNYTQFNGVHSWFNAPSGTAGNAISFTQAMTLDASGNLLVGTTSAFGTTGTTINPAGLIYSSADGDRSGQFDRTGVSDGEIVRFTKAGSTVGSIGVDSGDNLYIGGSVASHSGLYFGTNTAAPITAGTLTDAVTDLGTAGYRFKDLYLSGGVVFGATGGSVSSKTLDDYEEGTWTPTLEGTTSAGTTTYTDQSGNYTKIGNTVIIGFYISFTAATGTGEMKLGGLPFTQNAVNTNNVKLGGVMTDGLNWDVDGSLILMGTINTTYMRLGISRDDTAIHIQGVTNETATIWGSLTYITNS
jgi:hypothetical protein